MKLLAALLTVSLTSIGFLNDQMRDILSVWYKKNVPAKAIGYKTGIAGANVKQVATWFRN